MLNRIIDIFFPFRKLPGSAYVLFIARIINRFGDFVWFFLTLYLTRVLDMQPAEAGLVVTGVAIAGMTGGLVSGRLTDLIGRKRIMLSSQTISAAIIFVCGLYPNAKWLPFALLASHLFQGAIRPASQALVTDLTPVENRARVFGLLYLGINIGVSLGPIIAGFLFENHRRWIFWGNTITTMISVVLVARFVPEPSNKSVQQGSKWEKSDRSGTLRAFISRPIFINFILVMILANFIYAQVHFALPLLIDEIFGLSSPKKFGILMSINAITVIIFTPLYIKIASKNRPGKNMVIGAVCYAIGFGCLAFIPGLFSLILISTVIWTIGEIIFATNTRVFSSSYTPVNHRGRFAAIEQLAWGFGAMLSPALAGTLMEMLGVRGIWYVILALSVVVIVAMSSLDRRDAMSITR